MVSRSFNFLVSRLRGLACVCLVSSLAVSALAGEIVENKQFYGPKTTISYAEWGGADEVKESRAYCQAFVAANPSIRIDFSIYPWGQYWTKLQTEMASGIAPDVMAFYSGSFGVWAERGALLPLDGFVRQNHFDLSKLFPAAVSNCTWNGSLLAMPNNIAIWSLVYSKSKLEESGIPKNQWPQADRPMQWSQFMDLSRKLTLRNPDGSVRQFGMASGQNWEESMALMDGGLFVDRQVQPTRSIVAGNQNLYQGLVTLFEAEYADRSILGSTPISADTSVNNTDTILTSPRYAMGTTGPWALVQLQQAGVRFGVSPLPEGPVPSSLINVNSYGINAQCKHAQAAFRFIEFLTSKSVQDYIGSKLKGVPVLRSSVGSFINNSYHIEGCQAYIYDVIRARSSLTTSNPAIATDITNFFTDIGQKLDSAYDAKLSAVPRQQGQLSEADYLQFQNEMRVVVKQTVKDSLSKLNEQLNSDFEQAAPHAATFGQKVTAPLLLFVALIGFVGAYVVFSKKHQRQSLGQGMLAKDRVGYLFISPWLIGLTFFTVGPLIAALFLSFTHWNMVQPPQWVGIQHYQELPQSKYFWLGLKTTFTYAALVIPIALIGGIVTAGLLSTKIKGGALFRAIVYLPSLFTGAEAAVLWTHMLNKDHGILNEALGWFGIAPISWLDGAHAFYSVVMMNLFWIGGSMIIYYAGMKQIPASLYEAADLDGAGPVRKFTRITIPLLSPVILFLVTITTIGAFQVFTPALFFAKSSYDIGNPDNSLRFYAVNIYDAAFNKLQMGTACTYAVILFFIIFLISMIQMAIAKRFVYVEQEQ